jgi:hypothetical protein
LFLTVIQDELAVDDKTIQGILRHSNIGLTQNIYTKRVNESQVSAMDALGEKLGTCTVTERLSELRIDSMGNKWSRGRDLNPRPADYESAALPLSYLGDGAKRKNRSALRR